MRSIQRTYLLLTAVLAALWFWADSAFVNQPNFFAWRSALTNLTGVLGMGAMSVGMILSARPQRLEPWLGGLDKMYRLHKWLGISGLVLSVLHWALAKSPRYLIDLGWVERPDRRPRGPLPEGLQGLFLSNRKLAETVGEYAFYLMCVLLVLALVKHFPYKHFFKTHRWMAAVYLVLVAHAVVLLKWSFWSQAIGPVMAVLMALGSVAAAISLFKRVGITRRAVGEVTALNHHPEGQVLRVDVALKDRWDGHQAGQFAFVTFDAAEGPHPYTITSAWEGDGHLFFLIKGGGDYTNKLPQTLKVGAPCTVEGPYGRFLFDTRKPRQVWVAGGIGITPFIARMLQLARQQRQTGATQGDTHPDSPHIDLFWSTRVLEDHARQRVQADADAAGVRLHLLIGDQGERLDAQRIAQTVPHWQHGDVWFCGPAAFGQSLRQGLAALGLAPQDFHQELFQMR